MYKQKAFKRILLFVILASLCLIYGCASDAEPTTAQIFALDTVIDITAYGDNASEAVDGAKAEIRRLEKLLSVTDKDSDIYRINHFEGESVAVSGETYELIERAVGISALTESKFDITVYNVVKLWGFTTGEYRVPNESEIADALATVGYKNITLSEDNKATVEDGTQLDLGGIAKGYIADKAADVMKSFGIDYGIISLGGNVRTVGAKPKNESFIIGIRHIEESGHFAEVSVEELSVITSGGYQRNFTEDGVTYHHIIDPATGKPSESNAVSVSIIGKDGTLCDALSTAIYIGGTEYAEELRRTNENFEYVILTDDNTVHASKALEGKLETTEEYGNLQIEYH